MKQLQQLIQPQGTESVDFVEGVVAAMKEHLDANISFLAEFQKDRKVIRKIACDRADENTQEGSSFPLADTYCYRMESGELPNLIQDAAEDERVKDMAITRELDIGTYIGVPVTLPNGRTFGSLCCIFHKVESSVQPRDIRFMRVLADILGHHFGASESALEDLREKHERVEGVIKSKNIRMVFQPIVEIGTRRVIGVEALARFDVEPKRTPDVWFAEGWEVGLGRDLEMTAVELAIEQLPKLPDDVYLSINVSPETLQSQTLLDHLDKSDASRIVVEITEHAIVDEYAPLMAALEKLNSKRTRLAVDDVGAGYSGLGHIIRITPDVMKLDMSLIRGIAEDVVKQALASSAVAFASRVNIDIVAEGIETAEDANALHLLGVRYGQGYYYAKPDDLSKISSSIA